MNPVGAVMRFMSASFFEHNCSYEKNSSNVQMDFLSSKRIMSPVLSLSVSNKDQYPLLYMSPRRAGCKYFCTR